MKRLKILLVILVVVVNLVPAYSYAESQPFPEPTINFQPVDNTFPSDGLIANSNAVTIYVFSGSVLGLKLGKRIYPVYINGLLITGLDYSKYIRYETTATKFKVATMHIEVSSTKELLSTNFNGNPVYSDIIIKDAKLGEIYCFEIQSASVLNNNRLKQITTEEAQKRLKKYTEQEY